MIILDLSRPLEARPIRWRDERGEQAYRIYDTIHGILLRTTAFTLRGGGYMIAGLTYRTGLCVERKHQNIYV